MVYYLYAIIFLYIYKNFMGFPGCLVVKNLPVIQVPEKQVWSVGEEDPLEKKTATHPSILAWRIPWAGEPGGLESMGSQKSWTQHSD